MVLALPAVAGLRRVAHAGTPRAGAPGAAPPPRRGEQHRHDGRVGGPAAGPTVDPLADMFPPQFLADPTQTKWTVAAVNGADAGHSGNSRRTRTVVRTRRAPS